ncbi:Probable anion transporter 4, chloroplastic [Eumeta japonica]|uniref:Probable anion transporter 4, chloroplastic n=1 Tax=Eumeta variegata TaxID=151549 RepID=A0A4C1V6E9_EUMVA|nr:Probable anion transporter 4, chloroplastic [Eumeta japonica]
MVAPLSRIKAFKSRSVRLLGVRHVQALHVQALFLFLAMVLGLAMRVNMSMAIVTMSSPEVYGWTVKTQSVVLSSFFWGYIILQIPGGVMAARFGGGRLVLICIGINSAVMMLLPLAADYGDWGAVCARAESSKGCHKASCTRQCTRLLASGCRSRRKAVLAPLSMRVI